MMGLDMVEARVITTCFSLLGSPRQVILTPV